MDFNLYLRNYGQIVLSGNLPHTLQNYYISGSKVQAWEGEQGSILIQVINTPPRKIWLCTLECKEDMIIDASRENHLLSLFLSLEGNFEITYPALGIVQLDEGTFNFIYETDKEITGHFKKGKHLLVVVILTPEELAKHQFQVDVLSPMLQSISIGSSYRLLPPGSLINQKIADTVYELILYRDDTNWLHYFSAPVIKKLIVLLLREAYLILKSPDEKRIDLALMQKVAEWIKFNYQEEPQPELLAQQFRFPIGRLRKDFKEVYGDTLLGYWRKNRAMESKRLVTETDKSIKEIAILLGYAKPQNFSRAFKVAFSTTPEEMRADLKHEK
jgi:AraC-like DNA-binding protein